jgi:hypothetical protein
MLSLRHVVGVFCVVSASLFCIDAAVAVESDSAPRLTISQRTVEPLIKADKPWERYCLGYCQVIRTVKKWRMWYGSFDHRYQNDSENFLCYAESSDGLHWDKPDLGLILYDGSRHNNIILQAGVIGPSIFIDADAPPSDRYKMAYVKWTGGRWPVYGATSPDGLHWTLGNTPLLDFNSDTQQTCFRDGAGYRLFVRMWSGRKDFEGRRIVGESFSSSFGGFPPPRQILDVDERDPSNLQFYNSAVTKLRDGLYIAMPSGFYKGEDMSRVHAAISYDGEHFLRVGARPLLDVGSGFDRMALYVAPGAVAAEESGQYWMYYIGSAAGHDKSSPKHLKHTGGIGRFLITIEEFNRMP